MVTVSSLVFAGGLVVAMWSILATVLPAHRRIWKLLVDGAPMAAEPLPAVRLTSRRGVVRQRVATPALAPRAAA